MLFLLKALTVVNRQGTVVFMKFDFDEDRGDVYNGTFNPGLRIEFFPDNMDIDVGELEIEACYSESKATGN